MTKKLLNIIVLLALAATAAGQDTMRTVTLQDDPVYDSLVSCRTGMLERECSEESRLEAARKRFTAAGENERKTMQSEIIELEMSLFRLRDSLGTVSASINDLERHWTVENLGKTVQSPGAGSVTDASRQNPNIVYNSVFRETLPAEYFRHLIESQNGEGRVEEKIEQLNEKYSELADVAAVYMMADKKQADSLFVVLIGSSDSARAVADSLSALWDDIYDNKIYLYNWLLCDRHPDLLPVAEQQTQNVRRRLAEIAEGGYMYPELAAYPFEKSLVVHYELTIAGREGLSQAEDSLRKVAAGLLDLDRYLLPAIDLEQRVFLDLADIAVSQRPKYGTNNPIPKTEIHPKGTIYRILLGTYSKAQPVSVFRGVYPLSVERCDGKYHYFAGGFATLEEAQEAAVRAKKYGFANPRIAVWVDGEYSQSEAVSTTVATVCYRVEIAGADGGLNESIREVIAANARDKEISRVVDAASGLITFTVGSFDDIKAAQKLADAINSTDGAATANVIKL